MLALRTNEKPEKGENGKKIPRDEALNVLLRQYGYKTEVIVSYKPLEQINGLTSVDGWQRWVPLKTSNVALSFGILLRSHWLISMLVSSMSIVATPLNIDNAETLTFFIIHCTLFYIRET